jgi:class 3 adenylate cyclase
VHPLTLTLADPELESAWWADQAERAGHRQRRSVLALIALVVVFGVMDRIAFPGGYAHLWRVRAVVLALDLLALPAFFGPVQRLARWGQPALLWCAVVTLGGLWPVGRSIAPTATPEQLLFAVPAVVFGLMALFGASGLRFAWAAPVGVLVVAGFLAALWDAPAATPQFLLLTVAGGLSALAVGLLVSWSREAHARTDFLQRREVDRERARSERLLRVLMPEALALRLAAGPGPHLDRVDATVLFVTVVGYDPERYPPLAAVALLDRVLGELDEAAVEAGVERIKTIGGTVLLATGAPTPDPDHLARAARFALAAQRVVVGAGEREGVPLTTRIGLASGPVVCGVVGRTRFAFDVWGDTVNTASRLESHGEPGRIQLTEATGASLGPGFRVVPRGEVAVKGKGRLRTAWLEGGP